MKSSYPPTADTRSTPAPARQPTTHSDCLCCGGSSASVIYEVPKVPVHSVLTIHDRAQALDFPTGRIELVFCSDCGFISNRAFEDDRMAYAAGYEGTQAYSPTFNAFHQRLAHDLIERYDLHGKRVIEIGCGQGEFLHLLCSLGNNEGLGFDPAYVSTPDDPRVHIVAEAYTEHHTGHTADFICCKMTLEHIPDVADFVGMVRRSIGSRLDTVVFFQIPDAMRILEEAAFWDIYYEHCSYFTEPSLAYLFRQQGFDVGRIWTAYGDQYLMIEARPSPVRAGRTRTAHVPHTDRLDALQRQVDCFTRKVPLRHEAWRQWLRHLHRRGHTTILWGGGSKAVAFLTTLGVADEVAYVVDINPNKHGTYLAGTGHAVVSPDYVETHAPNVVIAMNPVYEREIGAMLDDRGVSPLLVTVDQDPLLRQLPL